MHLCTSDVLLFLFPLGQASGMAVPRIVSCGESCDVSVNGDAKTARLKRKKVCFLHLIYLHYIFLASFTCAC